MSLPSQAESKGALKRRRILILKNPVSGSAKGRGKKIFSHTLAELKNLGCKVDVMETWGPGAAEEMAFKADAATHDLIMVAGGDGTINEAVNGLVRRKNTQDLALALLPLGTANVLATEIGLNASPCAIARTAADGRSEKVFTAKAGDRHFILMAGAGFDARVVSRISPALKSLLGKGAYALESIRDIFATPGIAHQLTIDGKKYEAATVIATNIRHYAGAHLLASEASLTEATLEICLFLHSGRWATIGCIAALFTGQISRSKGIKIIKGRHIHLAGPKGLPLQVDGDPMGYLPIDIEAAAAAITLVMPDGVTDQ